MASKLELQAIIADGGLPVAERDEAARLLAELEKPTQKTVSESIDEFIAKVKTDYVAYLEDQNARFHVCDSCHKKQSKENAVCDLCGRTTWALAVIESSDGRRSRFIAAATTLSDEELNHFIRHSSMDLDYAAHCARILKLRGAPRVASFWERGGFSFYGRPVQT